MVHESRLLANSLVHEAIDVIPRLTSVRTRIACPANCRVASTTFGPRSSERAPIDTRTPSTTHRLGKCDREPGDIVVADEECIVVVPWEDAEDVYEDWRRVIDH